MKQVNKNTFFAVVGIVPNPYPTVSYSAREERLRER
jgi:hypothetical protein